MKELLEECGVHHFSTFQDVKAQIVEHFNRTLREAILQYMTDRQSLQYVEALPDFLYGYNNRPHSAIYPFWLFTSVQYTRSSMGIISLLNTKNINIR